jgi:hypothetical protein
MLEPNKDSEIERAWLQHEPARGEIPADVWRKLRAMKREWLPTAALVEGILKKEQLAQSLLEPAIRKRGIGRQRKLIDLRRMLPGANVKISFKDVLEVSWLSPKQAILADPQHQGEQQDCVLVCYLIAWPPSPRTIQAHSAWALEVSDHALARLLQRAPRADLRAVLFEAGIGFSAADAAAVVPHVGTDSSVYLPAGDGAFAATVIGAKTADGQKHFVYARASTWLSAAMLKADQKPLRRAASAEATVALRVWHWDQHGTAVPTFTQGSSPVGSGSGVT